MPDKRQLSSFEWVGGSLALDFNNTVTWDPGGLINERLDRPARVVAWAVEAGLVDAARAERIGATEGDSLLEEAHRVRRLVHEVLSGVVRGEGPTPALAHQFDLALAQTLGRLRLEPASEKWRWTWRAGWPVDGSDLLRPVIWAAARLLASDELLLLGSCAASDCGWLFLDRSRNRARRWCDMRGCGNNDKARRFYRRHRGERAS